MEHGRLLLEAPSEDEVATWQQAITELIRAAQAGEYTPRGQTGQEGHLYEAAVAGAHLAKLILNPPSRSLYGGSVS